MKPRYLLVAARQPTGWRPLLDRLGGRTSLAIAYDAFPVAVLANSHCGLQVLDGGGVVVGTLFHRHGSACAIKALDRADAGRVRESRGASLIQSDWGGYVAVLPGSGSLRILRDPSGALPCYFSSDGCYGLFASEADLVLDAGAVRSSLNWAALARHLYGAGLPWPETVIEGVRELLPGFALDPFAAGDDQETCWSPWDHVDRPRTSSRDMAERIGRTIQQCVRASTARFDRVLVSVSGGLDSSIVAASVAGAGPEAICLTMFDEEDPSGDERAYARILCDHLGLPLVERPFRLEDIDLDLSLSRHLPRPIGRSVAHAYEQTHLKVAREVSASAFVTGNGGDNVFAYSQSAAAIADRFLDEGLGMGVLRTLRDVCRQTGCGPFKAAANALRIARAPASYRWRPNPALLDRDLVAELSGTHLSHPWLEASPGGLPGKAGHIAALLRVMRNLEPGRSRHAPVLNPLVTQPLMEACLAVPSWSWRAGGADRAVARQAFARVLPDPVLRRRVKGGPDGFAARIIDHFRGGIRERLLDGQMARRGIIDVCAIDALLRDESPRLGEARVRLLELLEAETWISFWSGRAADLTGQGKRPIRS